MLRRILIAMISLAIIIACYLLYISMFSSQVVERHALPVMTMPVPRDVSGKPAVNVLAQMGMALQNSEGPNAWFNKYDPKLERKVYQFRSDHWRWINDHEVDFENPELRVFLRRGQILHISARRALVEVRQKRGEYDVARGQLSGDVHIWLDRSTDPNRTAPEQRREDIVHIWLEQAGFDLENGRVRSESDIAVESAVVELEGRGVEISWDRTTSRFKELKIDQGSKLILPLENEAMFGIGRKVKQPRKPSKGLFHRLAKISAGSTVRETPTAAEEDTEAESKKPRPYTLTLTRDVRVLQYEQQRLASTLTADELVVRFDLAGMAGSESEKKGKGTGKGKGSGQRGKEKHGRELDNRLEIFWKGPLVMAPESSGQPEPTAKGSGPAGSAGSELAEEADKGRFHVIAVTAKGRAVRFEQIGELTVACNELSYNRQSQHLTLVGTVEPVTIRQGTDVTIAGSKLFYERKENGGTVRGDGPGYMRQRREEKATDRQDTASRRGAAASAPIVQEMMVLWQKGFRIDFGTYDTYGGDGKKQFIRRAEFWGQASMKRPSKSESMAGERIVLTFLEPAPDEYKWKLARQMVKRLGTLSGKDKADPRDQVQQGKRLDTLYAKDNVVMKSADQQITCQELNVKFESGRGGQFPRHVDARGQVKIQEGERRIEAEHLIAEMEERKYEAEAEEAEERWRVALSRVEAVGSVLVFDPGREVTARCDKLICTFDPAAGEMAMIRCYLQGRDEVWAEAQTREQFIAGREITLDLKKEQVHVPGPGELRFVSDKDLDGSKLDDAAPIVVRWSESMLMRGLDKNEGEFVGKVHVQGKTTTLKCGRVLIDFEPAARPGQRQEKDMDIIQQFRRLTGLWKSRKEKSNLSPINLPAKRFTYIRAFPEEGKQVEVSNVTIRDGQKIGTTTLYGRELDIDLVESVLNVPGAGSMLIHDLRKPAKGKRSDDDKEGEPGQASFLGDPFEAGLEGGGPSVTGFWWKTALTYNLATRVAIFDGDVVMRHLSGESALDELFDGENKAGSKPARWVRLQCKMLIAEFMRGALGSSASIQGGAGALKRVSATGSVMMEEASMSVTGHELRYDRQDDLIVIRGRRNEPAEFFYDASSGTLIHHKGPEITWDRRHGTIQVDRSIITLQ